MRVLPVGPSAVLVEVGSAAAARSLASYVRGLGVAVDVVPGAETVLIDGVEAVPDLGDWSPETAAHVGEVVTLDVHWDGPDLTWVAERWGCTEAEVATRMEAVEFTAEFGGFAPGFSYLSGLPADLAVPRHATPRTRVPVGAVGLADAWCGVYPSASPGGWRLLGRTEAALWDVDRRPPALLAPGTRVRFRGTP